MQVIRTIPDIRNLLGDLRAGKSANRKAPLVGFVPTMGYLHEGHASLLQRARADCEIVVLSIFVNPLQFGPSEDFASYPRDEARDLQVAEAAGADIVFIPAVDEMYPRPVKTKVAVSGITERLCGASRPGHFDGVATVVTKLLHIVTPDRAYFGMKDAQQVAVIRQMTDDLNLPVTIVPCPIVREPDGLAKSSRNVYLLPEERKQALVLSQALQQVEGWLAECRGEIARVKQKMADFIRSAPLAHLDYVEIVSYPGLESLSEWPSAEAEEVLVALAVKFGKTRLIDNRLLRYGRSQ